jgi:PAS domain S-box-containing protein
MSVAVDPAKLLSAVGDALVVTDAAGAIILWNDGAERLFGFSAAEAIGQSMDIFIPDRLRKRHWDGYHETMRTGHTKYGTDVLRVPAITKAGAALSIAFTVAMLNDAAGDPEAVVAVIRDESARFQEDRKQRARIAELEAALLAAQAEKR